MFFVEDFIRLSAQMSRNEDELDEMLAPQRNQIALLQVQKEEMEKTIQEKIGSYQSKNFEEEENALKKIEKKISKLRAIEEEHRERMNEDFDFHIEKVVGRGKTEPHLIGKAIYLQESLILQLRCPVCKDICSVKNPLVEFKPSSITEERCKTCLECSDAGKINVDKESVKKIKELGLINQIISRLEGLLLIRTEHAKNKERE